jgi:hypothetical protein
MDKDLALLASAAHYLIQAKPKRVPQEHFARTPEMWSQRTVNLVVSTNSQLSHFAWNARLVRCVLVTVYVPHRHVPRALCAIKLVALLGHCNVLRVTGVSRVLKLPIPFLQLRQDQILVLLERIAPSV